MTVIYSNDYGHYLDHAQYVSTMYSMVKKSEIIAEPCFILPELFSINMPYKEEGKKKRKRKLKEHDKAYDEVAEAHGLFEKFFTILSKHSGQYPKPRSKDSSDVDNIRELSRELFEKTDFDFAGLSGKNDTKNAEFRKINGEMFLLPPNSRYFCGDVMEQCKRLISEGKKYSLIIADPPWWNKYIRRLKKANSKMGYKMMYNEDIASLPIRDLMQDTCLVVVWCTNSQSNIKAVKDIIFPAWGVTYLTTWYWVKVTNDFEPICEFNYGENKKQPFERILIGRFGSECVVPKPEVVMSVPSALHSHKPPLLELMKRLYMHDESPDTLELFARYMVSGTTSVGFEALKWQHHSLYNSDLLQLDS